MTFSNLDLAICTLLVFAQVSLHEAAVQCDERCYVTCPLLSSSTESNAGGVSSSVHARGVSSSVHVSFGLQNKDIVQSAVNVNRGTICKNRWRTYTGVCNVSDSDENCTYCSYLDVKYGRAPCKRFGASTLFDEPGDYNATKDEKICAQSPPDPNSPIITDEDCLYMNIFVPKNCGECNKKGLLPVMLYMPGGAFLAGSKNVREFGPDFLIPKCVVVVTINYRLGPFGFCNLGLNECPGNMGLADQRVAMEWINKYIACFGGNPKKVTLWGQSAGGISCYLHNQSPITPKEFFEQLIIMSPITTRRFLPRKDGVETAKDFAIFLGFNHSNVDDRECVLEFLQKLPPITIVKGYSDYLQNRTLTVSDFTFKGPPFWPSYNFEYPVDNPFFPTYGEKPGETSCSDKRFLIGVTSGDGDVFAAGNVDGIYDYVKYNIRYYLEALDKNFVKDNETLTKVNATVRAKYYRQPATGKYNDINVTVKLLTYFTWDKIYRLIEYFKNAYWNNQTWIYEFLYVGVNEFYKNAILGAAASLVPYLASHSGELTYVWCNKLAQSSCLETNESDKRVREQMTTLWTNFAKFGDPNGDQNDPGSTWFPIRPQLSGDYGILLMKEKFKFEPKQRHSEKQREFWDTLRSIYG